MHKHLPLPALGALIVAAAVAAILRFPQKPQTQSSRLSFEEPRREAASAFAPRPRSSVLTIYVTGEVLHPGLFQLPAGARVEAALRAAGGAARDADLIAVNLAEPLRDGEEVVLLAKGAGAGEPAVSGKCPSSTPRRRSRSSRPRASARGRKALSEPLDLNAADEGGLQSLPGIGPGLAARIVAYRRLNGPFAAVDDLRDVGGMTDGKVERLAPYLTVGP